MRVVETRRELAPALEELRARQDRLALVPTMGYLHEGHLALVDRARASGAGVAVSIFVNPLQFGPEEDYQRYPRDLERDARLAEERGVDLIFAPPVPEVYPHGQPEVTVDPGSLANRFCGAHRPGHFRGVLTVVARLLGLFRPDLAVFGRKDLQQAVLIQRMVRDLELGAEIVLAPLVRDSDGLAVSSRNALLDDAERAEALGLSRGLAAAAEAFRVGERDAGALAGMARERMGQHRGLEVEYLEVARGSDLVPVEGTCPEDAVLLAAGFVGRTRLIDNVALGEAAGLPGDLRTGGERGSSPAERPAPEPVGEEELHPDDLHPVLRRAAEGSLPEWARVSPEREEHIRRVAGLMDRWAAATGKTEAQRARWVAAAWLHDAVRDESPVALRQVVPRSLQDLPDPILHGPAAATLLREEGVDDESLLLAVAYHTLGHPDLDELGRSLHLADFLEPGRPFLRSWREGLRERMPGEMDAVLRDVVRARMIHAAEQGWPLRHETAGLWNRLVEESA